ncbi:polysaccharide pyruvyl transferase family protein [Acinetobacter towneri]|uniref:polysaccharide pyruvyl transferase family protein n=1 Tax=Acinetobacter towneri TaxID=202956 RepID=UPI003A886A32
MYQDVVNFLRRLDHLGFYHVKVSGTLCYFQSEKYNFAFDIVHHQHFISIDFVYRSGIVDTRFIKQKYTRITGNKIRILTALQDAGPQIFFDKIKTDFLELVFLYHENKKNNQYFVNKENELLVGKPLKFWFSDGIANFGDFMTPWLASQLTNRPIKNVRTDLSSDGAILGVGSIVQYITPNHKNIKIWGSGLISSDKHNDIASRLKKMNVSKVFACRGELTYGFFKKYDFECNSVLGDPGLLFGNLYSPRKAKKYKYAIVPHYIHYQFFKDLNIEDCVIVDVRKELTSVIDEIANSQACISTSLHGLIISQSYDIPWMHLYINDGRLLIGENFKFNDFFSILESKDIAKTSINLADINANSIIKLLNETKLPQFKSNYSYDALIESFYESINS